MIDYSKKNSFTIIELLAVISIIVILAAITIGVYSYIKTKTYNDKTMAIIKKVEMAMRAAQQDRGYYTQQSTLGSLTIDTTDDVLLDHIDYSKMLQSGEINSSNHLVDAWGQEILYQCPGSNNRTMFDLISIGENGVNNNGTGDDITNFTNY